RGISLAPAPHRRWYNLPDGSTLLYRPVRLYGGTCRGNGLLPHLGDRPGRQRGADPAGLADVVGAVRPGPFGAGRPAPVRPRPGGGCRSGCPWPARAAGAAGPAGPASSRATPATAAASTGPPPASTSPSRPTHTTGPSCPSPSPRPACRTPGSTCTSGSPGR